MIGIRSIEEARPHSNGKGAIALEAPASAAPQPRPAAARTPAQHSTLFLAGRPSLKQYIRFARTNAVRPRSTATLADEWRAAAAIVRDLHRTEAGCADDPPIVPVPVEGHERLLAEFLA